MKKRNLKKLSLEKSVISNLNLKKITGGSQLCLQTIQGAPTECESSLNHECNFACH